VKSVFVIASFLLSLSAYAQEHSKGTGEIGSGGVDIQNNAPFAVFFGFDCSSDDSEVNFLVGPAGPDESNFPSDMTTPRKLEISKGDSLNSESQVKCKFSPTEAICQGPYLQLHIDLTQMQQKLTLLGALGGVDDHVTAPAIATVKVEGLLWDKTSKEKFTCDLIR